LEIWRSTNKVIFFITHDVDEALLLGTRILVMQPNPGRIMNSLSNPLKKMNLTSSELKTTKEFNDLHSYLMSLIKKGEGVGKNVR
jgi:taurine transport system ATP-binding protein